MPGLDLPITVEWVGPDGVVMTSEGNRVLGEKEVEGTMRTLSLTFDPILASNGGDYTCRVSIFANWTKSQPPQHAVTVHIPVISECMCVARKVELAASDVVGDSYTKHVLKPQK